jgi:hypothetical protein
MFNKGHHNKIVPNKHYDPQSDIHMPGQEALAWGVVIGHKPGRQIAVQGVVPDGY